jgi:hypothetical protein
MRKYSEFQYEIDETNDGKYVGILYKPDGKDVLQRTGEYDIAQGAYLEITKIINKILDKSNKP